MVTKQYQKSKGSQFEYECVDNLKKVFEPFAEVYLTKERGFQRQFDIEIITKLEGDTPLSIAVECKKHKSISWNQARKWFEKLEQKATAHSEHWLLMTYNRQPVVLMGRSEGIVVMLEAEEYLSTLTRSEVKWTRR